MNNGTDTATCSVNSYPLGIRDGALTCQSIESGVEMPAIPNHAYPSMEMLVGVILVSLLVGLFLGSLCARKEPA